LVSALILVLKIIGISVFLLQRSGWKTVSGI
jgi:hypothetical protein